MPAAASICHRRARSGRGVGQGQGDAAASTGSTAGTQLSATPRPPQLWLEGAEGLRSPGGGAQPGRLTGP